VTWGSQDSLVASVNSSGQVVATGVGNTRVIATIAGGYADTLFVRVTNDPTSVDIVPPTITLASVGDSSVPAVDIKNSRGAALTRTSVLWRSADTTVSVTATGIIVARAAGSTFVIATTPDSARADTVTVTVTNAPDVLTLNRVTDTLTALGRTIQYTADVRNKRGALIAGAAPTFRSLNASIATISPGGLATATGVGRDTIIAEVPVGAGLGLKADTAILQVRNDVFSIIVTPTALTIASVGGTGTLTADPRNIDGAAVTGIQVTWLSADTTVARVNTSGVVNGVAVGLTTVTASVAGKSASAAITVLNAPDTVDILTPDTTLKSVGDTVVLRVKLRNSLGTNLPVNSADWTTADGTIAQVQHDTVIATGRGTTTVTAANPLNSARRDQIVITVTNAPALVNVVRVLDTLPSLNQSLTYTADVFSARGQLIPNEPVTWVSRTPAVAVISAAGIATSISVGGTWIVATAGTGADSARLVVTNNAATVSISPSSATIGSIGDSVLLTATARNVQGSVIGGAAIIWSSNNTGIATVSPAGYVKAVSTGTAQITATVNSVAASVNVTVGNAPAVVQITSLDTTLASVGDSWTPAVNIRNSLGTTLPRDAVTWTTSDPNVATVSSLGVVAATGAGAAVITATSPVNGALTASRTVTVTNAPASLVLSRPGPPAADTLTALTRTEQLGAVVTNARTIVIANPSIAWTSSNGSIASVDATGLVTANAVGGPVRIIATAGTVRDTVNVVVTNNAVSLALTPDTVTVLDTNGTVQLTAVARNDVNNLVSGSAITWTSLTPAVATVNSSGLVDVKNVGVVAITASVNTGPALRADTSFVTVANAPRAPLNIVPTSRTLTSVGDTALPQITIQNSTGQPLPRSAVLWTSSAPNVATVNNLGHISSLATGLTTITATSPYDPTLFDSYALTVTDVPATVSISNTAVTLTALTRTFTFTATVRNGRGVPLLGPTVNYNSLNAGRVTVGPTSGTATAVDTTTGTKIAVVVSGAPTVSDTAVVTVTNNPTSVTVSPTAVAYTAVGESSLVTLTAVNDLGNPISNPQVVWTTNNQAVVKFLPTFGAPTVGPSITTLDTVRLKAIGAGSTSITVTAGGVTSSVSVSVSNNLDTVQIIPASGTINSLQDTLFPAVRFANSLGVGLGRTAAIWSTTNSAVATVASDGVITGVGLGTAKVYAVSPANAALKDSIDVTVNNVPANVSVSASRDTLTAVGQGFTLAATVLNGRGAAIPGASVTWSSDNPAVATVGSTTGTVGAVGLGTAHIFASAAPAVADTDTVVVVNPTDLYVNKDSSSLALQNGTLRRPFASIQAALGVADNGDVIWVKKAATTYAENLSVGTAVTIRAMPADTGALGANCSSSTGRCATPANLPTLTHNSGAASIRVLNGAGLVLRHIAIEHNADGPAVQADTADLETDFVYVNPSRGTTQGRGVLVRHDPFSPNSAYVHRTYVRQAKGYGVRFEGVTNGRVDTVGVDTVSAVGGTQVGIHVIGGSTNRVAHAHVNGTTGQDGISLSNTRNAALRSDTVRLGQHALRADSSSWADTALVLRSGARGMYLGIADTMTSDTARIGQTTDAAVALDGPNHVVSLNRVRTDTASTTTDSAAIDVRSGATAARLTVRNSRLNTAGRRAVRMATGATLVMRNDTIVGPASGGALDSARAVVTATSLTDSVSVVRSVIRSFPGRFALNVGAANRVHVDSNQILRNRRGINIAGTTPANFRMTGNDIFDNVNAVGLTSATSTNPDSVLVNWWGSTVGPRRYVLTAGDASDSIAVGDSVDLVSAAFTTADFGVVQSTPNWGAGGTADSVHLVRGSGQTVAASSTAPRRLTVRVVDANGRPVSGVTIRFQFTSTCNSGSSDDDDLTTSMISFPTGQCQTPTVDTDANGLAEARVHPDNGTGRTITVTATRSTAGLNTVTFTITVP
jgi:uncharacterized protein YjdB